MGEMREREDERRATRGRVREMKNERWPVGGVREKKGDDRGSDREGGGEENVNE